MAELGTNEPALGTIEVHDAGDAFAGLRWAGGDPIGLPAFELYRAIVRRMGGVFEPRDKWTVFRLDVVTNVVRELQRRRFRVALIGEVISCAVDAHEAKERELAAHHNTPLPGPSVTRG